MVVAAIPHYRLTSQSFVHPYPHWRFLREDLQGGERFEASDFEPETSHERLELLALVRGLESLDGPSSLSLLTTSRYVHQGLAYGLADWRQNNWQWESFGLLVPIKHSDLWRRVDQALQYHRVEETELSVEFALIHGRRPQRPSSGLFRLNRLGARPVRPARSRMRHVSFGSLDGSAICEFSG